MNFDIIYKKLVSVSPNNIITFFILKHLTNTEYQFINYENDIIYISNFSSNYNLFFHELKNIILNMDYVIDTKFLIKGLQYLLSEFEKKPEYYLFIGFILLLLFLSLKVNSTNIVKHLELKFNIKIEIVYDEVLEEKLILENISLLAKKYDYLLYLDREHFVTSIINDKSYNKSNKKFDLILNKSSIIDVSKNTCKLPKKITDVSKLDNKLIKLIDIINCIINKLNIEMIKLNPNTLIIYKEFIEPNIDVNLISIDEIFYILYDIILPYLKDNYGINKYIDYFH